MPLYRFHTYPHSFNNQGFFSASVELCKKCWACSHGPYFLNTNPQTLKSHLVQQVVHTTTGTKESGIAHEKSRSMALVSCSPGDKELNWILSRIIDTVYILLSTISFTTQIMLLMEHICWSKHMYNSTAVPYR